MQNDWIVDKVSRLSGKRYIRMLRTFDVPKVYAVEFHAATGEAHERKEFHDRPEAEAFYDRTLELLTAATSGLENK